MLGRALARPNVFSIICVILLVLNDSLVRANASACAA